MRQRNQIMVTEVVAKGQALRAVFRKLDDLWGKTADLLDLTRPWESDL